MLFTKDNKFSSNRPALKSFLKALFRSRNFELSLPRWPHFENPRTFVTMFLSLSSRCRFPWVQQQDWSLCLPTAESLKTEIFLHPLNVLIPNPEWLGCAQPSSCYKGLSVGLRHCHLLNLSLLRILDSGWDDLAWFKKAFSLKCVERLYCSSIKDRTFVQAATCLWIRRHRFFHPTLNGTTLQAKFVHPRP